MSQVLVLTPSALHLLAICGTVTALFGSVVMLTQTSIKKSLAYSTVAQMGFMMLQCGLGAFSSAFLHIVAHSLYKAHAFLSSGSIVEIARARWVPTAHKDPHPVQLAAALAVALPITLLIGLAFGVTLGGEPGTLALGIVLQTALAYLLWNAFDGRFTPSIAAIGVVMSVAVGFAYFLLQALFARLLDGVVPTPVPEAGPFDQIMAVTLSVLFMALLLLQTRFPDRRSSRNWQAAYVHCLNGFYLSTLANRLIQHCWPVRITDRHSS
jgi:NAD(P)H-quinone oxidoreductase subunit 5